jgi:Glutamine amidotransferase domain
MATFLAIYNKSKNKNATALNKVVDDFSVGGTRTVIKKEYEGFLFYAVSKFQSSVYQNEQSLSFVSGHISFEKLNIPLHKSTIKNFNAFMANSTIKNVALLEGEFAAIHYQKESHTLTFLNDKFGVFPLFIVEDDDVIILSNEYQPLAQYSNQLDTTAISEFLTLGVTLGDKTFYKKIKNVAPASLVISYQGETRYHTYWEHKTVTIAAFEIKDLAKKAYDLFTKINQEYSNAKVSDLCLLTAGADSRLIVATLSKQQLSETPFYTSNLSFLNPLEDKDVIGASALAKSFGFNHTVDKISFYENSFNQRYFDKERALRDKHLYGGWHGGELLGGFCLNAAPINKELNFKEVDKTYKSIFNWWFRLKQSTHPYQSYKKELKKLNGNEFLFMIHQLTRSFFTNIYSGTRGHWVQPFQLMNHAFSPFWDSRFLQLLLQVPFSELKNYNFYNQVFTHIDKTFTQIPTNSPLANRADSVIPKMNNGIEPKHQMPNTHHKAYTDCLNDAKIWKRKYYNKKKLMNTLENEFDPTTKQWLDFEVWYLRYSK